MLTVITKGRRKRNELLALPSGHRSIRFRLPFVMTEAEADQLLERVAAAQPARV